MSRDIFQHQNLIANEKDVSGAISTASCASHYEQHDEQDHLPQLSTLEEINVFSSLSPLTSCQGALGTVMFMPSQENSFKSTSSLFKLWKDADITSGIDNADEEYLQVDEHEWELSQGQATTSLLRNDSSSNFYDSAMKQAEVNINNDLNFPAGFGTMHAASPQQNFPAAKQDFSTSSVNTSTQSSSFRFSLNYRHDDSAFQLPNTLCTDTSTGKPLSPSRTPTMTPATAASPSKMCESPRSGCSPCSSVLSVESTWRRMTDAELCTLAKQGVPQQCNSVVRAECNAQSTAAMMDCSIGDVVPPQDENGHIGSLHAFEQHLQNRYEHFECPKSHLDSGTFRRVSGYMKIAERLTLSPVAEQARTAQDSTEGTLHVEAPIDTLIAKWVTAASTVSTPATAAPQADIAGKSATLLTRARVNEVTCTVCHKVYRGATNLRRHMKREHAGIPKRTARRKRCDICNEEMLLTNLKAHIRVVHEKPARHFCVACNNAGFSSKRAYTRHVRVQHGVAPSACNESKLIHSPCPVSGCYYVASSLSNMQRHVEIVHMKLKRFGCERCGAEFGTKSNLEVHECKEVVGA